MRVTPIQEIRELAPLLNPNADLNEMVNAFMKYVGVGYRAIGLGLTVTAVGELAGLWDAGMANYAGQNLQSVASFRSSIEQVVAGMTMWSMGCATSWYINAHTNVVDILTDRIEHSRRYLAHQYNRLRH